MHHASRHVQCSSIPSGKAGRLAVSVQIELRRIDGGRKITSVLRQYAPIAG